MTGKTGKASKTKRPSMNALRDRLAEVDAQAMEEARAAEIDAAAEAGQAAAKAEAARGPWLTVTDGEGVVLGRLSLAGYDLSKPMARAAIMDEIQSALAGRE